MRMTLSTNLSQFSQLYVGQTTCALQKNFCYSGNLSLLTFYQGTRSGTWVWWVAGATNETTGGWRQSLYHSCFCSIYSSKILYKSKASNKIVIKHAWLAKAVQLCQKHVKKRGSATSQMRKGWNKHLTTNITSNDVSWNASHLCFLESWWMTKGIQGVDFKKVTINKTASTFHRKQFARNLWRNSKHAQCSTTFFPLVPWYAKLSPLVKPGAEWAATKFV